MSLVQTVTNVPVHSFLRGLGYLVGRGAQKDALAGARGEGPWGKEQTR